MNEAMREWRKVFQNQNFTPEIVIKQFFSFLASAWDEHKHTIEIGDNENSITKRLVYQIHNAIRNNDDIHWTLYTQPEIMEEDITGKVKTIGQCDIVISFIKHDYNFECKRLWPKGINNSFNDSAHLYVTKGLRRFLQPSKTQSTFKAQYNSWLGRVGMIGYVMDGRVSEALPAILVAINKYSPAQTIKSPSQPVCPTEGAHHFYSIHNDCNEQTIRVNHVLLPVVVVTTDPGLATLAAQKTLL